MNRIELENHQNLKRIADALDRIAKYMRPEDKKSVKCLQCTEKAEYNLDSIPLCHEHFWNPKNQEEIEIMIAKMKK